MSISRYLKKYDNKTKKVILSNSRNIILESKKHLDILIDEALDDHNINKSLHFGIIDFNKIQEIKKRIRNMPFSKNDILKNSNYDLVMNQSEIRHIIDGKNNMSREDVHIYINKLPDIVLNSDYISYSKNEKSEGLRFKKILSDGTYVSFLLISNKKNTLTAKSIYMEKEDYEHKKRNISLSNDTILVPDRTSKTNRAFASNRNISKKDYTVNR